MFMVFDDFASWAAEAGKPITTTCLNDPACVPAAFGSVGGLCQVTVDGLAIDDGDWFSFSGNPQISAIGFTGHEIRGRPFGICIMGMGRLDKAPLYMYSRTGFIGVVRKSSSTWTPNQIHAAPRCADVINLMHFAT